MLPLACTATFFAAGERPAALAMLVVVHHAATDYESSRIIRAELSVHMHAFCLSQQPPALPPLPVQYVDYACWEQARQASMREAETEWWCARLQARAVAVR